MLAQPHPSLSPTCRYGNHLNGVRERGCACGTSTTQWKLAPQCSRPISRYPSILIASASGRDTEQDEAEPERSDLVELGTFGPPHGVRGELRLRPITDSLDERLSQPGRKWAWLQGARRKQPLRPVEIESIKDMISKGRETWLVKVEGVDSVGEADQLRGYTLCMLAADRPELNSEDDFYVQELIGMKVILHVSKEVVGTVVDVFDGTGTHDLLRVDMSGAGEPSVADRASAAFVPFAKEIVPMVDREARVLEITPPEGLLNIPKLLKNPTTLKKRRLRRNKRGNSDKAEPIAV